MKLIIAGTRTLYPRSTFLEACIAQFGLSPTEIVCGGAKGVDTVGKSVAEYNGWPVKTFLPNWDLFGKAAGPHRNGEMAHYADALLLIWNGWSPGSASMKGAMLQLNKPIHEVILKETSNVKELSR
jgi:hypothetical protein